MSCVGFGTDPFSTGQFGITDWAEEALWKAIPLIYRDLDLTQGNFLRETVNGYKPPFNELRQFIDSIPAQRDPHDCNSNMLDLLANDFNVKTDDYKPDDFRRSAVIHISQQLLLKGTDRGYTVLGATEGYIITVTGLWETSCGSGILTSTGPTFVPDFDEVPADILPLDTDYPTEFGAFERVETFTPALGATTVTLLNPAVRYVHVYKNGVEMPQGSGLAGSFTFTSPNKINLVTAANGADVYVVHEIDGFKLHPTLDPNPRCRSHSLNLTISLGPPQGWITPLDVLVSRLNAKVKPIHVTFNTLVYTQTFPTIFSGIVSFSMGNDIAMTIEETPEFDVSPADIEPLDGPKVDFRVTLAP